MGQLTDIPIILLAAGASSRMGGADKLLQIVDGKPLIRRQAELARSVTRGLVIVALPPPPHPRYDALAGIEALLIPVMAAAEGMNASLRTAFAALPRDAPAAMLLLADLPDLTRHDLGQVLAAIDEDALIWRGAAQDGTPGHPVIFDASLFDAFADLTGDTGGQDVVRQAAGHVVHVPLPGTHALRDLDTVADWEKWRAQNPDRCG